MNVSSARAGLSVYLTSARAGLSVYMSSARGVWSYKYVIRYGWIVSLYFIRLGRMVI